VARKIPNGTVVSYCELCGIPLLEDEVYGTDDMNLCRFHHEKFYQLLAFMLTGQILNFNTLKEGKQ